MPDRVSIRIDGELIHARFGQTILEAALAHGKFIPSLCHLKGLTPVGACRLCLVEVAGVGRLLPACTTPVQDGMAVTTRNEKLDRYRRMILELLFSERNHICAVCVSNNHCELQAMAQRLGVTHVRFPYSFPRAPVDATHRQFVLDQNRCILCTRCVRFMRDIDGDPQIGIVDRGYHSEIATYREEGVHSLLSGNLADICPVGAITTRDYRFKSRPWDNPNAVDTICTFCEKGCNTTVWIKAKPEWAKGAQLVRITPRFNAAINSYWMCDIGRFGYHWVEGDHRLVQPAVRAGAGLQAVSWQEALARAGSALAAEPPRTRWLVSAHASHEEMFLLARLAQELVGEAARGAMAVAWTATRKAQPEHTKFRVPDVDAPNVAGARALGLVAPDATAPDLAPLREAVDRGEVTTLYVLDPGPQGSLGDVSWIAAARARGAIRTLVVQAAVSGPLADAADVVLPGCTWVEKHAAYTNATGQLQSTHKAIVPPGEARDDWQILVDVALAAGVALDYPTLPAVRQAIVTLMPEEPAFRGLTELEYLKPGKARHWLETSNPSERVKWDTLFLDQPPFKFERMFDPAPRRHVIELKPVK